MMVELFDWDARNVDHIARHRITPEEVEEVFEGRHHLMRGRDGRYIALGRTATGRYLFCVMEKSAQVGQIRIVTARDAEPREKRLFKRKA